MKVKIYASGDSLFYGVEHTFICEINRKVLGLSRRLNPAAVSSFDASLDYFDTTELKIAAIIRSITKNHYFPDGNKRTAALIYGILATINNLPLLSDNDLGSKIEDIAKSHYSIEKIALLLF